MRIAIDARLWSESGLGRYIRNLINELQVLDKTNEYYILLLNKDYDHVTFQNKHFYKVLTDIKWYGLREQIELPKILYNLNPDLVHFPHFNIPILYKGKFVVTIHDLIHQHYQTRETTTHNPILHAVKRAGYKKVFCYAVNKSNKIFVPSQFVKKQIRDQWGIEEGKIVVTYEGVDEKIVNLARIISSKDFQNVADKFIIKKPYLFYVGNAQPHKNLSRLINVFRIVKQRCPDLSLVLSGPENYFWEKIKKEFQLSDVIFTGFITDREMVTLYENASTFVMPSLEEGFGIPVLEAMACSCPVVSSNAASLPEVGGNATVYFDPKKEYDMVEKISLLVNNKKLRKELIQKGLKRYKEYSWKKMSEQTLEIYNNT